MLSPAGAQALSVVVFVGIALAPFALSIWEYLHGHYDTYGEYVIRKYNQIMSRIVWRCQISGPLPLADNQGGVIICNHQSGIDPGFIALSTPRRVHWMVAREYYEAPIISWAFKRLQCIPVGRGGVDTKATKAAIRFAREGNLVGVFPEGRINDTDQLLLPGRPGAALIALKARVPVVPCYVEGSPYDGTALGSLLMTAQVRLTVGPPIDLSPYYDSEGDKAVLEEITRRFLKEIARLAGVTNYEPRLAGRRWKPGQEDADYRVPEAAAARS